MATKKSKNDLTLLTVEIKDENGNILYTQTMGYNKKSNRLKNLPNPVYVKSQIKEKLEQIEEGKMPL